MDSLDCTEKIRAEMRLFCFGGIALLVISVAILYHRQLQFKKKRRKDDIFLEVEEDDEGEAQYLVSFFTGTGYKRPPTARVSLHLIGSLYPGKFHVLANLDTVVDLDDAEEEDKDSEIQSHDGPRTLFKPNSHEKFMITEDVCLGRITTVVLHTDVAGHHPFWGCQTVIVRDVSTNQAWYFRAKCSIGFPPKILDSATAEELTTFTRSWHRRVHREVRHGQYIFFGFWFRLRSSVYSFCQRITVAIICYFHLLCNSIITLGLAFPPVQELDGNCSRNRSMRDSIDMFDNNDANYWLHVIISGLVAAIITSCSGYVLVTLFRQKSKYETRIQEMDYVIGTALQEFNETKDKLLKLRALTGKPIQRKGSASLSKLNTLERNQKSLERVFQETMSTSKSVPNLSRISMAGDVKSEEKMTDKAPEPVPIHKNTSWNPLRKLSKTFSRKKVAEKLPTVREVKPPKKHLDEKFAKPNVARKSTDHKPDPKSTAVTGQPSVFSRISQIFYRKKSLNSATSSESAPLLDHVEGMDKSSMEFPRRSTLFEPGGYELLKMSTTPFEKREEMRRLFEGEKNDSNLVRKKSSVKVEFKNGGNYDAVAPPPPIPIDEGESGLQEDLNRNDVMPLRKFPRPVFGWIAILVIIILPISVILTLVVSTLKIDVLHFQMVITTFVAGLLLDTFVIETLKMALLGAYYAYTDKTIYKRILRLHQKPKHRKKKKKQNVG